MALIDICQTANTPKNSGSECGKALGNPKGIIAVPGNAKWNQSDMDTDFYAFIKTKMHTTASSRWYPFFQNLKNFEAPPESPQIETFADGTMKLVRLGSYNLTFSFADGGECGAKFLLSLNKKGYRFIIVDEDSQFKYRKNADGTFSGLKPSDLYSPGPDQKTPSAVFMNKLVANISVDEYVNKAEISKNDTDLTELVGLFDTKVTSAAAATTTKLKIAVNTICANTDLVALYDATLAVVGNFIVTNKATGAAVVCSAAAVVGGHIELTGVFASASTFTVALAAASVLKAAGIEGYEGTQSVDILIP